MKNDTNSNDLDSFIETINTRLIENVGTYFGYTPEQIHNTSIKPQQLSMARHIIMYVMRKRNKHSYPDIAQFINITLAHTVAIYGVSRIEKLIAEGNTLVQNIVNTAMKEEDSFVNEHAPEVYKNKKHA